MQLIESDDAETAKAVSRATTPMAVEFEGIERPLGSVVDLFCGAGGLSHGFYTEGFSISAGIDVDEDCRFAFEHNNEAPFLRESVSDLSVERLNGLFFPDEPRILVGCAPCQPFSTYNQKNDDPKWKLVSKFCDLICDAKPDVVSMENVPRLLEFQGGEVFEDFVSRLRISGYHVSHKVVFAPDYGVPQRRSRLVLLASLRGDLELEPPTHSPEAYVTVDQAIGALANIEAGNRDPDDRMHAASRLSPKNLERIKASRPGGSWRDWREDLVAECHRNSSGKTYGSVYGRMKPDEPAPTITTQFFGFGNGRFGHPTQDRALSLREGALLQSFPPTYAFVEPAKPVHFKKLGRMIGNAVPVTLGRVIARSIRRHLAGV